MLLLPHHLEFAETLANLPFFYNQVASNTCETMHVIQKNANNVPELVHADRLREFLLGGEIDETVEYIDGYANELDENEESTLSWELGDEWLGSI